MLEQKSREILYFKIPVFVVDLFIHLMVLYLLEKLLPMDSIEDLFANNKKITFLYCNLALSLGLSLSIFGLRLHERKINPWLVVFRAFMQSILTYVLLAASTGMVFNFIPRHLFTYQILISTPLIMLFHWTANKMVRYLRTMGRNTRHAVIIGADENAKRLYRELTFGQSFTGYKVNGYFTSFEDPKLPEGAELLGTINEFYDWITENRPDEIYCSLSPVDSKKDINRIIKICNDNFIDFYFVPTMDGYPKRQMAITNFGKVTIMGLRQEPLNTLTAKIWKRSMDILISGLFLCTLYPFVLLFVWIGNKITGNVGPLYFKQVRTGYNGKGFKIYKFRSMKVNKDADKLQATENDPRKTPFGDFLRRSSIDELPQFINVFLGDMSIIGPRPHMEFHTEMYSELINDYMVRHLAKPGITGWAQISGCRGETKTVEEMADRVEHDIWYIEHWSPLLDVEIFFRTIWQVLPGHDKQAY